MGDLCARTTFVIVNVRVEKTRTSPDDWVSEAEADADEEPVAEGLASGD
jgi:hypothetical protein